MFGPRFGAVVVSAVCVSGALAQVASSGFPAGAVAAKTVAIVNETGSHEVEKGAVAALQMWGQFRVVEDPEQADLTLRFMKNRTHEGTSTQKTDENGKQADSYSLSFSSSIRMTASLKDAETSFYSTKTDDGKAKAGTSCVNDFHTAFRTALQQRAQPRTARP